MTGTFQNADGLLVKYAETTRFNRRNYNRLRHVSTYGCIKQYIMEVDLASIGASAVWYPADLNNDGTRDGFSDEECFLPLGASVIRALYVTTVAAIGGTDFIVGTFGITGTAIDADGFVTAGNGAIANAGAVGEIIIGTGAQMGDATGDVGLTAKSFVAVTTNGTFTAGRGLLVIEVLDPIIP